VRAVIKPWEFDCVFTQRTLYAQTFVGISWIWLSGAGGLIGGGAPRCATSLKSLKWRAGGGTERGFSQGPVAAANISDQIKYSMIG
jgi:hypothetical protein